MSRHRRVQRSDSSQPVFKFQLSNSSVLDAVFTSKSSSASSGRRAVYSTTTRGAVTKLWKIDRKGVVEERAVISWCGEDPGTPATNHGGGTVTIHGEARRLEDILKKGRGIFPSDSRTFNAESRTCKWKSGSFGDRVLDCTLSPLPTLLWRCHELLAPHSPSPGSPSTSCFPFSSCASSSSSSSPTNTRILATFIPRQAGVLKPELSIYPAGSTLMDDIILTAILLTAPKGAWRKLFPSSEPMTAKSLEGSYRRMRGCRHRIHSKSNEHDGSTQETGGSMATLPRYPSKSLLRPRTASSAVDGMNAKRKYPFSESEESVGSISDPPPYSEYEIT